MSKDEILIIGINSFLGKAIYLLTKDEFLITGVYNENTENIPADIQLVQINSIDTLKERFYKYIYLISSYVPGLDDDQKLFEANILLPEKISAFFPKSRILFCSSISVYENAENKVISIADKPAPNSKYALSKLWGEHIISKHASYGILRISSMYGVGMKASTFIPLIIKNAIEKGNIVLFGDGSRMQNYIHVDDVANIAILMAKKNENLTLLAVGDRSYSNLDVAKMILKIVPGKVYFSGHDNTKSKVYDNSATHALLGKLKFKSIENGLIQLITWSKKEY